MQRYSGRSRKLKRQISKQIKAKYGQTECLELGDQEGEDKGELCKKDVSIAAPKLFTVLDLIEKGRERGESILDVRNMRVSASNCGAESNFFNRGERRSVGIFWVQAKSEMRPKYLLQINKGYCKILTRFSRDLLARGDNKISY